MYPEQFGIGYCVNDSCRCWGELQDNGRWLVHLPSTVVSFTWVDPADPRNNVRWGAVRGTLDHPTTHPPQETP
jgi:hypothetical protein